jgi:cytochrome c553
MTDRSSPSGAIRLVAILAAALGAAAASPASGQPAAPAPPADVSGIIHVCSSCHGPGGHSISSTFPRLAAQQKDYIEAQLKAFRDHTRADPHALTYMWGMAARLTNPQIAGIASYYSSQPAVPGQPDNSPDAAAGKKIFTQGIPSEHVPACHACHGAEGHGLSAFPRLAGQHRAYIERQLRAFASNQRTNPIMHANSKDLTEQQIRDVAAYVRTLN